ncbi:alpha-L-arabinofuranosidase [Dyadobacter sp. UP-52]|uniref:Alpha-L-arabinofuranosidase n=2 Tax=Dyadobacter subterraneus TaxID=2773304 RepID=A0ABR9W9I4_9BACT|nr:alpha-L-arabinofuranosidase [Dyadobacter subterraneus]
MRVAKKYLSRIMLPLWLMILIFSCKKTDVISQDPKPTDQQIKPAKDPENAKTMGLFIDSWLPKTFMVPGFTQSDIPASAAVTVTVDASEVMTKILPTSFGHNANTWMTPMVTEPVFMNHITNLKPNIIRFPAGSGSDVYFWNAKPGSLPADVPTLLTDKDNTKKDPGYGFGKTNDNWRASLDNYYDVLRQSGSKGVLTMNYGYARYGTSANPVATAAHLAADWVRYDKGRTQYWEIGNENYGDWEWGYRIDVSKNKDGQPEYLTGKLYAQHFKVFADSMRKAAAEVGAKISIGAVMYESEPESWQTNTVKTWNGGMLTEAADKPDFYIVHNYFTPYEQNSTAAVILDAALSQPAKMMNYVTQTITSSGAAVKPIAMTEWNMWAKSSKQQVSNVSGVFAALVVGESLVNKYGLAARWDLLNFWADGDDHGLFSDGNEPNVAKWTPRPSFYYLYFLQKTIGDRLVKSVVQAGNTAIKSYASTFSSGEANVTLVNISNFSQSVEVKFENLKKGDRYYWYSLEGSSDNGEFSRKVLINGSGPLGLAGGPSDYMTLKAKSALTKNGIRVIIPARGMVTMVVDK